MPETKKRFSDFAKEHCPLDGEKIRITEVFNKEILVLGYRLTPSKYHKSLPCLHLQFQLGTERHVLFTSSMVLVEQIETYKGELPFVAIIKQVGKFYTFT